MWTTKNIAALLLKIGALCLVLILSNYIYTKYLWEDDLVKYDAHVLLDLFDKEDTCDAIYFGESSNFSFHENDTQTLSISSLIDEQMPYRIGSINKGAYHAGIYYDLINRISSEKVKMVIVTVNLRTLNQATIHAPIETALQKQARMFKQCPPLWNRLMLTLNEYDDASVAERDKQMWYEWTFDTLVSSEVKFPYPTIKTWCAAEKFPLPNGEEDLPKRMLADHNIKAFAFQIDIEKNVRVQQLDDIVRLCREKEIDLVFNLLAENVEYADSLVGPELVYIMRQNRDKLVSHYKRNGVVIVDNLELVAGRHYTDQEWTTEHYDQVGRQQIADNVVRHLPKKLSK